MTRWPTTKYNGGRECAFVHGGLDKFAEALGRFPKNLEIVLYAAMVDVTLWDAEHVWYVHSVFGRTAKVVGPFKVRNFTFESAGHDRVYAYIMADDSRRKLKASFCWTTKELAESQAKEINEANRLSR